MKTQSIRMVVVALVAAAGILWFEQPAPAVLTTFTYTGAGADPNVWGDEENWLNGGVVNGYPTEVLNGETLAVIPDGKSPSFTTGVSNLYRLQTGSGTVSFNGGLSCHNASPYNPSIAIGLGGVSVAGSVYASRGPISTAGNLSITGNLQHWGQSLTQTGGSLTLGGDMIFSEQVDTAIRAWVFASPYNGTFRNGSVFDRTITWTGTPNFAGGRPNYNFVQGGDGGTWDVGGYTLLGNNLTIGNWSGSTTRYGRMLVSGGTIDVNTLTVNYNGTGYTRWNYLSAQNASIYIRGAGTAWSIQTEGNADFDITNGTTVYLEPTGGSLSIDTGSKDRGGNGLDIADFDNNFSFGNLRIGSGNTVTVTGNANIEGGGLNALYVRGALALEDDSTLQLTDLSGNRHNAYLNGPLSVGNSPGTATISGGDFAMTPNASFAVEINGLTPGSQHDQLIITGAGSDIALAGTLDPTFSGFVASAGDVVFIIRNDGGTTTGAFTGLADDALVGSFLGKDWNITYNADFATLALDGGNDVALYAIPEPATAAALGLAGLLALRRRARVG